MTVAELWLRPATQDEFEQWLPGQEAAYAREIAESGALPATAAAEKARRDMAWVNDVEVDPEYRGRGYGRAAMLLAEREARVRGMTSLGLNVHGQNTVARSLYDSLGYQVTAQQMRKPV